jgi:hypothetical protein
MPEFEIEALQRIYDALSRWDVDEFANGVTHDFELVLPEGDSRDRHLNDGLSGQRARPAVHQHGSHAVDRCRPGGKLGPPGTPMEMAPVAYELWQRFLRFDPEDMAELPRCVRQALAPRVPRGDSSRDTKLRRDGDGSADWRHGA